MELIQTALLTPDQVRERIATGTDPALLIGSSTIGGRALIADVNPRKIRVTKRLGYLNSFQPLYLTVTPGPDGSQIRGQFRLLGGTRAIMTVTFGVPTALGAWGVITYLIVGNVGLAMASLVELAMGAGLLSWIWTSRGAGEATRQEILAKVQALLK